MECCPHCFSDKFLGKHIDAISNTNGKCSFCKTNNVTLIEPTILFDRFEPLFELYEINKTGISLNNLIQEDWKIFNIDSSTVQQRLLKAIAGDKNLFKSKYVAKFAKEQKNIDQWENFREELKHNNRFFPENALDIDHLEPFAPYIGIHLKKSIQKFYRARINTSEKPHPISKMGKPPKKSASSGRANPVGIPYLYLASTIDTAISEIRGNKGETLTIAEFEMKNDLELADLRDPISTISPFELNEEDELELIYKNMPFLTLLGNELSKPIIPREATLEYLPSQYLCELLKKIGFHGIIYKSSLADGNNYVIFNDKKLELVNTYQYKVTDVKTESQKLN